MMILPRSLYTDHIKLLLGTLCTNNASAASSLSNTAFCVRLITESGCCENALQDKQFIKASFTELDWLQGHVHACTWDSLQLDLNKPPLICTCQCWS